MGFDHTTPNQEKLGHFVKWNKFDLKNRVYSLSTLFHWQKCKEKIPQCFHWTA